MLDTRGGSDWGTVGAGSSGLFEQPGFTPAQILPNVNRQITGADGRYGWNGVTGCWYVTDLDIDLVAGEMPKRLVFLPVVRK